MIVIGLLAGIVAGIASAGIARAGLPEFTAEPAVETNSVQAVRALITRCLPGINTTAQAVTSGLERLAEHDEKAVLGDREGRVFIEGESFLLIDFDDAPVCRVVALSVDPAILADLVLQVFAAAEDTFQPQRVRVDTDGGFSAVFQGAQSVAGIEVRVITTRQTNGNVFASLSVERMGTVSN